MAQQEIEHFRAQKNKTFTTVFCEIAFSAVHLLVLMFYSHYLFESDSLSLFRRIALISLGWIYFVRLLVTTFVFGSRNTGFGEVFGVAFVFSFVHFSFAFLARTGGDHHVAMDAVSLSLYAVGSFLNSYSEFQRYQFKKSPASKGRLYTKGLFAWSRHPNYFGDSLLFLGWGLTTNSWPNIWVSLFMTSGFLFQHIPDLEAYLEQRYAAEWKQYKHAVPPFVPFIHSPTYTTKAHQQ